MDGQPGADSRKHVNQMSFNGSVPYEMYNYGAIPASYYPTHGSKSLSIDYTSSNLDEKDRRRKKSDASKSSDKDSMTNMHLVSGKAFESNNTDWTRGGELKIVLRNVHSENAKKSMSKVSNINSKSSTKSIKIYFNHIPNKPKKCPD